MRAAAGPKETRNSDMRASGETGIYPFWRQRLAVTYVTARVWKTKTRPSAVTRSLREHRNDSHNQAHKRQIPGENDGQGGTHFRFANAGKTDRRQHQGPNGKDINE